MTQSELLTDLAFKYVIAAVTDDQKHIWNSVELSEEYRSHGGDELTSSQPLAKLCKYFDGDLLILSSQGYANIIAFKNQASALLKITNLEDDNNNTSIQNVEKQVVKDCAAISLDKVCCNHDDQQSRGSLEFSVLSWYSVPQTCH